MLVLGLGLKVKFCGLGLGTLALTLEVWPWQKNSRPKSWQTTQFTSNFHLLEHGDWSKLYFKIRIPYLLIVGNHGLLRVLEKTALCYFLS